MRIPTQIVLGFGLTTGLALTMGAKCNPVSDLPCLTDQTCIDVEEGGRCEAQGFCTFPDEECMTGRRWHDRAPESIAGDCWDPAAAMGTDSATDTDDSTGGMSTTSGGTSTSTSTSTTTTTTTTSTSTSTTTSGSSSGAGMTCDEQYGGAADYMLCVEEPDSCSFNVTVGMAQNCNDVCTSLGGMCVGAELNDVDLCTSTGPTNCDDNTVNDLICVCDRM